MTSRQAKIQEDTHFRIMRILQDNPDLTQRELADKLGMSVGGLNYCLNALIDKGFVKMANFSKSKNKFKYVYLLTPQGIAEKVALVGVSDLVVVETADAVLVTSKSRSQHVKHIVAQLQNTKREEQTLHRKVHRPWGWYDSIDEGGRFKVKRIQVKPKASLSLQKHHHRAEHWIVVTGTAEITNGDKVLTLTENQSTYIPLGEVHRLVNPGSIPLEIIEVQSGSYLGEDDIVRFEDTYGRTNS